MIAQTTRISQIYGHYFDATLVNDDLVRACNELGAMCQNVRSQPQWVPASWVR